MLSVHLPAETSGHIGLRPVSAVSSVSGRLYGTLPVRPVSRLSPQNAPRLGTAGTAKQKCSSVFSYCLFSGTFLYLISAARPSRQSLFRSVRPVFSSLPISLPGSGASYLQICTTSRAIHKFVSQLKSPEREIFQESHEFRRLTPVPALA